MRRISKNISAIPMTTPSTNPEMKLPICLLSNTAYPLIVSVCCIEGLRYWDLLPVSGDSDFSSGANLQIIFFPSHSLGNATITENPFILDVLITLSLSR